MCFIDIKSYGILIVFCSKLFIFEDSMRSNLVFLPDLNQFHHIKDIMDATLTSSYFLSNLTNSTFRKQSQTDQKFDNTALAMIVFSITFGLLIAFENLVVLFAAFRNKTIRENIHYNLVLSLSFSDLLFGVNVTLFGVTQSKLISTRIGLLTICRINLCLGCIAYLMSIWQTFFISLNRYLVISEKPLNQMLWKGKRIYVVYSATWFCNLVLYLSMMAPKDEGGFEDEDHICNTITVYGDNFFVYNAIFCASIAVSLFFTFVFYTLALWAVRKMYRRTDNQNPTSGQQNGVLNQMAIRQRNRIMKSMKLVTMVLVVLILSLGPTMGLGFYNNRSPNEFLLLVCFSSFSSAANPIIYCIQIEDFKKEIQKMFFLR